MAAPLNKVHSAGLRKQDWMVLGYYTGTQESYDSIKAFHDFITTISVDIYAVQLDGSISGRDDLNVRGLSQSLGMQAFAGVTNYNADPHVEDFDAALAQSALVTNKDKVISGIIALALDSGYDGINIDFENLAFSSDIALDRQDFSDFTHELALRLHSEGLQLIVSVPAKTVDSKEDDWSYPFDYPALGQDADYLQLMTYDQHGPWGQPGPVAGVPWVTDCIAYSVTVVDSSKLLIGLPAYGYDWDLTASDPAAGTWTAESFSWSKIPDLTAKPGASVHADEQTLAASSSYSEIGQAHTAWFETMASIQAKTKIAADYQLGGISMWSLGQEDLSFWQAVAAGWE